MKSPSHNISVLFIHHGYEIAGGAPVSLVNLILALQRVGTLNMKLACHDDEVRAFFAEQTTIPVASLDNPFTYVGKISIGLAKFESWRAIKLFLTSLWAFPGSIRKQTRFFKTEAPDIIHLNSSVLFSSAIAANLVGIPVVWHIREIIQGGRFNLRRRLAAGLIKALATRIIAISPAEAFSLGNRNSSKIKVVYNSYDTTLLNPDLYNQFEEKRRLGYPERAKIILSLGGLSSNKGTVELIEAMAEQDDNTFLLLAGPPLSIPAFCLTKQSMKALRKAEIPSKLLHNLKKLKYLKFDRQEDFVNVVRESIEPKEWEQYDHQIIAAARNFPPLRIRSVLFLESLLINMKLKKGLTWYYPQRVKLAMNNLQRECARFFGKVKNVTPLLAACDVLGFAGMVPHFPRPVYEAGLMKKPVVVFDMQGITANVEDGITGLIVKKRSGKILGQALYQLLSDPKRRIDMGIAGHQKANSIPSAAEAASSVLTIYDEIIMNSGNTL